MDQIVMHSESARGCGEFAITIEQHLIFARGAKVLTRFQGRTALVTGASRGIGAAVALLLAKQGADVAINFRSKGSRAEQIAAEVHALGRRSLLAQADLTDESGVNAMADAIRKTFGKLHVLVLNASGGLEKDKPASYAKELNLTAQVRVLDAMLPTVLEFAAAIVDAAADASRPNGHVTYVGATD